MILGPLQKFWVNNMRKHPERQTDSILGVGTPEDYEACCLGELHLCAFRLKKKKLPFVEFFKGDYDQMVYLNYHLKDNLRILAEGSNTRLDYVYKDYGLRSDDGSFEKSVIIKGNNYISLADMNDNGLTWAEIADYVEVNPENVFIHSV